MGNFESKTRTDVILKFILRKFRKFYVKLIKIQLPSLIIRNTKTDVKEGIEKIINEIIIPKFKNKVSEIDTNTLNVVLKSFYCQIFTKSKRSKFGSEFRDKIEKLMSHFTYKLLK